MPRLLVVRTRTVLTAVLAGVLVGSLAAGCTSDAGDPAGAPAPSTAPSTGTSALEPAQPVPRAGECRAFGLKAALAPVSKVEPRPCGRPHTAETFLVGRLDLVQDGHRLAVDSPAVQARPVRRCTERLARHLRADPRELRLSMAQAVWFSPSVEDATAGADWFRCDLVVVAAPDRLLPLPRRTAGMGSPESIAMCATAEPGTPGFSRVVCSRPHSWRAVSTVDLPGRTPPAPQAAADLMEEPCRAAARARAADPLDFEWSQESPTAQQWRAGQHYGICWVPA